MKTIKRIFQSIPVIGLLFLAASAVFAQDAKAPFTLTLSACNLPPGESSSSRILLSRIYKFDRPGKYTVQVFRFDPDLTDAQGNPVKVLSNTITITG